MFLFSAMFLRMQVEKKLACHIGKMDLHMAHLEVVKNFHLDKIHGIVMRRLHVEFGKGGQTTPLSWSNLSLHKGLRESAQIST